MTLDTIFEDKSIKSKAKVAKIGNWLLEETLPIDELLAFTEKHSKATKASCIEAMEYATKKNPKLADETVLQFVTSALNDNEPRIKWESAKVIGNIAKLYPENLSSPISNLLKNTSFDGAVVRWATAFALGEILKLKTIHNNTLIKEIESLLEIEKDNGVKNKYLKALKKIG